MTCVGIDLDDRGAGPCAHIGFRSSGRFAPSARSTSRPSPTAVADRAAKQRGVCDAFCRTHDAVGRFDTDSWSSHTRTPALYPDAVTLRPAVPVERLLSGVDASAGCSIKDSFADLDLTPMGFEILFRAEWLYQPPSGGTDAARGWSVVTMPADLEWRESAWGGSARHAPLLPGCAPDERGRRRPCETRGGTTDHGGDSEPERDTDRAYQPL